MSSNDLVVSSTTIIGFDIVMMMWIMVSCFWNHLLFVLFVCPVTHLMWGFALDPWKHCNFLTGMLKTAFLSQEAQFVADIAKISINAFWGENCVSSQGKMLITNLLPLLSEVNKYIQMIWICDLCWWICNWDSHCQNTIDGHNFAILLSDEIIIGPPGELS